MQNGNHKNRVFSAAVVNRQTRLPTLPRRQLTMTGVAGVEEIEDGLTAARHLPPKHSTSLARVVLVPKCL